jgi:DNA-binding response OmpR family regulator
MGAALANLVSVTLRHGAYECRVANSVRGLADVVRDWQPQLAIVDIDQHFDAIAALRDAAQMPLLAFTRRRQAALKLKAYEAGVDDIVEVPFTLDEIIARPYALMRRARGIITPLVPTIRLNGSLEVDIVQQTVAVDGSKSLQLTPIQQALLYILAANEGEVLSRETLIASVWGDFQIESNVVDRHIRELRVKLGDDWRSPRYIETIAGKGYRYRGQRGHDDPSQ